MAYRLKSKEPVPDEVRRIVREELESAANELSGGGEKDRDEAIHEARKSVKKLRAVLRLVRPELGGVYDVENIRLRNLGRRLSEFRDAGAIIETFDKLREKYRGELGRRTLATVRRQLERDKIEHAKSAGIQSALSQTAASLRRTLRRLNSWPTLSDGFGAIGPGFEETYRQGRQALARVNKNPTDANYHEWRKVVKYHWYHIRLLESLWTEVMQAYEKSLKDLETWLGDDHNLVVLRERIEANPTAYGSLRTADLTVRFIRAYQKELREDSVSLGERVYDEKPAHVRHHMHGVWDSWQSQPKSLKKQQKQAAEKTKTDAADSSEDAVASDHLAIEGSA